MCAFICWKQGATSAAGAAAAPSATSFLPEHCTGALLLLYLQTIYASASTVVLLTSFLRVCRSTQSFGYWALNEPKYSKSNFLKCNQDICLHRLLTPKMFVMFIDFKFVNNLSFICRSIYKICQICTICTSPLTPNFPLSTPPLPLPLLLQAFSPPRQAQGGLTRGYILLWETGKLSQFSFPHKLGKPHIMRQSNGHFLDIPAQEL